MKMAPPSKSFWQCLGIRQQLHKVKC